MRTVAVYFTKPGFDDYPFDDPEYRKAYALIGRLLAERGVAFSIVRGQSTYQGGNTFKGGWKWKEDGWTRVHGKHAYDLIFNKGRIVLDEGARVINDPALDRLCIDKWETFTRFTRLCPSTFLVQNKSELDAAVRDLDEKIIVAKPVDAEGGNGVIIGPAADVLAGVETYPYLIQELIDTSHGIPGIADGKHDLRMVIVRGEIVSAFVREPARGKYVANVSQGGSIRNVPVSALPASAREIVQKIDNEFSAFPYRVYSVDVGLHAGRVWQLIELNSQPGLAFADYEESEEGKRLFVRVVDLLAEAAGA